MEVEWRRRKGDSRRHFKEKMREKRENEV